MIQPLQMIKPIGKPQPPIVFKSNEGEGQEIVKRDTLETVEYSDGSHALIKSSYVGDQIKDRTVSVFKGADTKVKTYVQVINKKEVGTKLDKMA